MPNIERWYASASPFFFFAPFPSAQDDRLLIRVLRMFSICITARMKLGRYVPKHVSARQPSSFQVRPSVSLDEGVTKGQILL